MKAKLLILAMATVAPVAQAAVTITPMLGYHYMDTAEDKQRDALKPAGEISGVAQESDVHEALAAGIELTERVSAELEYGQTQTYANTTNRSGNKGRYDSRQQNYNLNFLINNSLFGLETTKFRPYALIGAGQTNIEEKSELAHYDASIGRNVKASSEDTLVNLGYGFRYHFNRMLALRGEGRLAYNTDNKWIEPMALLGLQLRLGTVGAPAPMTTTYVPPALPTPVPATPSPIDSDRDGVFDPQDQCPGTAIEVKVDTVGCPMELVEDVTIPLKVLFDTNKWDIKPQFNDEIAKVATFMKQYPNTTAVIEGHTDIRGSRELNRKLSANRAEAVKRALVMQFGIEASRLSSAGYGPDRPVASNSTAEGMQQNRRTIAVVTGKARRVIKK